MPSFFKNWVYDEPPWVDYPGTMGENEPPRDTGNVPLPEGFSGTVKMTVNMQIATIATPGNPASVHFLTGEYRCYVYRIGSGNAEPMTAPFFTTTFEKVEAARKQAPTGYPANGATGGVLGTNLNGVAVACQFNSDGVSPVLHVGSGQEVLGYSVRSVIEGMIP